MSLFNHFQSKVFPQFVLRRNSRDIIFCSKIMVNRKGLFGLFPSSLRHFWRI